MGASKSKETDNQFESELDFSIDQENLKFVKQVDDWRYGKCKIFKSDKIDHSIAVVRQILQRDSEIELKKFQDQAQELSYLDHDSVIKLLRHITSKKSEFCSSFWKVSLFYEYVSNDLETDIQKRKKEQVFYDESELWHIIVSVIAALAYLRSRGFEHGDIKPQSVLLSDQGKIKLLPKAVNKSSQNMNNYMQALMGMNKAKYLSPILLKSLEQQTQTPQHNCTKSDIFSLGLVILEAALLHDSDDIYDLVNFQINPQTLNSKLEYVREKYSLQLTEFIQSMLILDELERPDIDILFAYIEDLCHQGVQMADRIFSLDLKDRQPTYNFSHEDLANQSQDLYDIRNDQQHDSVKRSPMNYLTPQKDNLQLGQMYISPNSVITRQEKVRRSKWTLDENTDNNIYIGSASSQITPAINVSSNATQKQYTFGDYGQSTINNNNNNYLKSSVSTNVYISPLTNQYIPSASSTANLGIFSTVPNNYVPMLVKDGTYTPTLRSASNHYAYNPTISNNNYDLNNLDSINKIISKYTTTTTV